MDLQKESIHDKDWPEVEINSYAIFLGYLLMGVRGLGFLVLTWTTVVLLGGFVSILQTKDFWCLTVITLVQTAGVFDFLSKEKASDVGNSLKGLRVAIQATVIVKVSFKKQKDIFGTPLKNNKEDDEPSTRRLLVGVVLWAIQLLVLVTVLCLLAVLYVLGMYLSAGISLWRLLQHDYGNLDGGANLKQALNVLYTLAVAQVVVYGCWAIYNSAPARTVLVNGVADEYSLKRDLVSDYLDETVAGCMKDPSFARGRNLVTHAVGLLVESKSEYGYLSGVLILGSTDLKFGQSSLMKQLLAGCGSSSFIHVLQRLQETFGPRSSYSTEIRMRAARIVANVADSILLDQFPAQGRVVIQFISSLLLDEATAASTGSGSYRGLVVQGVQILRKLAADEENCRVMANTQGLLSMTMATLGGTETDQLHGDDHYGWAIIAEESLEVMNRLMIAALGGGAETTMLRTSEISSNSQATILRTLLECHKCEFLLKKRAAHVLLHLPPVDPPCMVPDGTGSTIFVWILLLEIFLLPDYHFPGKNSSYTKRLAGEKMQAMISGKTEPNMLPSVVGDVIGILAGTVAGAEKNAYYRIHAATILMHLCCLYTEGEHLKELKKAMANAMPEVLKEIAHCLTTEEKQAVTEPNNSGGNVLLGEECQDLEQGGVPHGNDDGQESSTTSHQQKGEQLQALLELCSAINTQWIDKDHDLTHQLNETVAKICSGQGMLQKTFREFVEEACEIKERSEWEAFVRARRTV